MLYEQKPLDACIKVYIVVDIHGQYLQSKFCKLLELIKRMFGKACMVPISRIRWWQQWTWIKSHGRLPSHMHQIFFFISRSQSNLRRSLRMVSWYHYYNCEKYLPSPLKPMGLVLIEQYLPNISGPVSVLSFSSFIIERIWGSVNSLVGDVMINWRKAARTTWIKALIILQWRDSMRPTCGFSTEIIRNLSIWFVESRNYVN